ncbi:hypothetical protein AB0D12_31775 [Streptomyces sp. NPDC048479]|uniref:hypothetical protein n=1 Tax=Streptomyces sp. NPDC048479 TaxID=3154725 RepID=UPI00343C98B2
MAGPFDHDAPLAAADVHTADNAVPPLDEDLAGCLDDLAGVHPGIDLIRDGYRLLATDRLDTDQTQTILATLAGSPGADVTTLLALLVQRLTNPDSNPCLRALDPDAQKTVKHLGQVHAFETAAFATRPYEPVAEASAAIDGI